MVTLKRSIVLFLTSMMVFATLFLCLFPLPALADETERDRLIRIETKLDTIIEQQARLDKQYQTLDNRVDAVERRVDKHGTWWGAVWAVLGLFAAYLLPQIGKAVVAYIKQPKPTQEEC